MIGKSLLTITLAGLLTACAGASQQHSLSEKLEGKTPEERQEILRVACLNEAEHTGNKPRRATTGHRSHRHGDSADTKRMKDICREMTDEYQVEK
jgi:Flp pilus assembly protein TadD